MIQVPILQTSNWSGTFFAVSYSKPALATKWSEVKISPCWNIDRTPQFKLQQRPRPTPLEATVGSKPSWKIFGPKLIKNFKMNFTAILKKDFEYWKYHKLYIVKFNLQQRLRPTPLEATMGPKPSWRILGPKHLWRILKGILQQFWKGILNIEKMIKYIVKSVTEVEANTTGGHNGAGRLLPCNVK